MSRSTRLEYKPIAALTLAVVLVAPSLAQTVRPVIVQYYGAARTVWARLGATSTTARVKAAIGLYSRRVLRLMLIPHKAWAWMFSVPA